MVRFHPRPARIVDLGTDPNAMKLPAAALDTVRAESIRAYPEECCGALLGRGSVSEEVVPLDNVSRDPQRAFEIDPEVLLALDRDAAARDLEILGYYHSHPNGSAEPSLTDLRSAWPETLYLIVGISIDGSSDPAVEVRGWRLPEGGSRFEAVTIVETS